MYFWQKQLLNLGAKGLEKTVKDEEKRKKQMDAFVNYLNRDGDAPFELRSMLQALDERVKNIGKKHKNRSVERDETYLWGQAWGYKICNENHKFYTEIEDTALQNIMAYWYGRCADEEIFLKNVILYGEG